MARYSVSTVPRLAPESEPEALEFPGCRRCVSRARRSPTARAASSTGTPTPRSESTRPRSGDSGNASTTPTTPTTDQPPPPEPAPTASTLVVAPSPVSAWCRHGESHVAGARNRRRARTARCLQPIGVAVAPAAARVDITATTLVAPPHVPPHAIGMYRDPELSHAEAAQRGEVPLQRRRVLHPPHHAVPGGVRKPLRRRSRQPAGTPHRCPRRVAFAGFEMRFRRAHYTARTALPVPQPSLSARPRRYASEAADRRIGGATKAFHFLDVRVPPDSLRRRLGAADHAAGFASPPSAGRLVGMSMARGALAATPAVLGED